MHRAPLPRIPAPTGEAYADPPAYQRIVPPRVPCRHRMRWAPSRTEIEIRCGIGTGTNAFKLRRHGRKYGGMQRRYGGRAEEIRRRRSGILRKYEANTGMIIERDGESKEQ